MVVGAPLANRQGICSTSGSQLNPIRPFFSKCQRSAKLQRTHHNHLAPCCSIKARWCIDIRYGVKLDAVALLQDWVTQIGSQAGLDMSRTQILSGSIGVPESRLEMEVEFDTLAELEVFWSSIPQQDHKAWSERARNLIIDGSPQWEVYRTVPVAGAGALGTSAIQSEPSSTGRKDAAASAGYSAATAGGLILNTKTFTFEEKPSASQDSESQNRPEEKGAQSQGEDGKKVILDWKGDPMTINPGDKLPFF